MSNLRKSTASNTNLKKLNSQTPSATTSGSSTPISTMDRTDSILNLTKPSLYGIYNDNSLLNLNKELNSSSIEITNSHNHHHDPNHIHTIQHQLHQLEQASNFNGGSIDLANSQSISMDSVISSSIDGSNDDIDSSSPSHKNSHTLANTPLLFKILLLSSSAFIYNEITKQINYNHFGENELATFPMTITNVFFFSLLEKFKFSNYIPINDKFIMIIDQVVALSIQGLLMGTIHPIMDQLLPSKFSRRILSSNPDPNHSTNYSNLFNDLLRASITFLGISYAIRNIEWNSFLQVSIIFSFLNPGLWILLDGTFSGFLSSLIISGLACLMVYLENYTFINQYNFFNHEDLIALWLWIGSFFFCGLIIFGKIGRGLFGRA
ncbi:insulin-induced protein-domain-containing protein [Scheffersomyces coipomensis]|uniref:insulin-induced protein-domain-containing protein n=1 Tax=Scheffersomyces coipomensis TaxID=1788519 RepID=UPI00315D63BD